MRTHNWLPAFVVAAAVAVSGCNSNANDAADLRAAEKAAEAIGLRVVSAEPWYYDGQVKLRVTVDGCDDVFTMNFNGGRIYFPAESSHEIDTVQDVRETPAYHERCN